MIFSLSEPISANAVKINFVIEIYINGAQSVNILCSGVMAN